MFLVPFRIYTKYFGEFQEFISFVEVLPGGVCFKGYKNAIPHPMSIIIFLGKGVKDTPKMHGDFTENRMIHRMSLEKPHTFDSAVSICRLNGLPQNKIHILVNHSNMAPLLSDERLEAAAESWDDAFACLVPFYSFSKAFTKGFRQASFVAFSSPILSNFEGEAKVRFCSCLFLFSPKDAQLEKLLTTDYTHCSINGLQAFINLPKYR